MTARALGRMAATGGQKRKTCSDHQPEPLTKVLKVKMFRSRAKKAFAIGPPAPISDQTGGRMKKILAFVFAGLYALPAGAADTAESPPELPVIDGSEVN